MSTNESILVVESKVKAVVKEAGLRSDGDLTEALSTKLREILAAAQARCVANGRSTIRPCDL